MVDHGEDDSAADELEFDLNKLREARPDLAPEIQDANGLVDFDREVATNKSRPLSVDEIVNECLPLPVETVEDGSSNEDEDPDEPISPPSQYEVDEAIEILKDFTIHKRFGSWSLTSESLKQNKSKKIEQIETIFY